MQMWKDGQTDGIKETLYMYMLQQYFTYMYTM